MRYTRYVVLVFGSVFATIATTIATYYATRAAIRAELPAYEHPQDEVSGAVVRRCLNFCVIHKDALATVSPLSCTCAGGRWTRLQ